MEHLSDSITPAQSPPHSPLPSLCPPVSQRAARSVWHSKAVWLVGAGLLANAAVSLYTHATGNAPDLILDRTAFAQIGGAQANPGPMLGARGIFMMPAQLGPQSYGLYLMDVDAGTICIYQTAPESRRFRLMAVRSFKYDRYLEDFNNDAPKPKDVQDLIEKQRTRIDLQTKGEMPTVDQTTRPDDNQPVTPATGPMNIPATGPAGGAGFVPPDMMRDKQP